MTIRTLIVEDEPLARTRVRQLLAPHEDIEIVAECGNAAEAREVLQVRNPELLIVDIHLPTENGLDFVRGISSAKQPVIIFTTAYGEHALEAYDFNTADYLVKPFDAERLDRALDRARRLIGSGERSLAPRKRGERRERFAVRSRGEIIFIRTAQIDWISAEGNYSRLHAGDSSHLLRESMQNLEDGLDANSFIRVHRSAIVNLDRVQKLVTGAEGALSIVLTTGATVPLGPSYRGRLEQMLGQKL